MWVMLDQFLLNQVGDEERDFGSASRGRRWVRSGGHSAWRLREGDCAFFHNITLCGDSNRPLIT